MNQDDNAVQVYTPHLPVDVAMLMQKEVEDIARRIGAPSGNMIRITQDKKFIFPDGSQSGDPFEAVIIEFASGNFLYPNDYSRDNREDPTCFALGLEPNALAPSARSPQAQAEKCIDCNMNKFGSGKGNAKACKNTRILAMLPPDAESDTPLQVLRLSPTATRVFDGYVANIAGAFRALPIGVVSTIGFDPGQSYATIQFGKPRANGEVQEMWARREEARALLLREPELRSKETLADNQQQAAAQQAQASPAAGAVGRSGVIPRIRR